MRVRPPLVFLAVAGLASCASDEAFDPDKEDALPVGLAVRRVFDGVPLSLPTDFKPSPESDERFYVLEQPGTIKLIEGAPDKVKSFKLAADLSGRVLSGTADKVTFEEGLYTMVFHPGFPSPRQVFISYSGKNDAGQPGAEKNLALFVSRFTVKGDGTIDTGSEQVLLKIKKDRGNHNGGSLAFERKGADLAETTNLLIGVGDGGFPGDPNKRGVNPATLLSKILKIDIARPDQQRNKPYSIPVDNPFRSDRRCPDGLSQAELEARADCFQPEVWSWGHRNPWRMSVDPFTGEVFEAEVGQESFEEVNRIRPGQHYGWSFKEGPKELNGGRRKDIERMLRADKGEAINEPVISYDPRAGRSVTGGLVYRGDDPGLGIFRGAYVFGDFVNGNLMAMFADKERKKFQFKLAGVTGLKIGSFGEDADGNLYVLHTDANGEIYQIVEGPPPPDVDADIHFFLSRDGTGNAASGTEYYKGICAIIDASNEQKCAGETATPTLDAWNKRYLDGQPQRAALYFNRGDLGFWRDMTCTEQVIAGRGGCSVTNWKTPDAKARFEALSEAERANPASKSLFDLGTVTMTISADGFTRFYVFVPQVENGKFVRKLSPVAVLDFEGPKGVPQLCTPCHGGQYVGPDSPDMGAMFREFDPNILDLRPGVSATAADAEFHGLNDVVYGANKALFDAKAKAGADPNVDEAMANYRRLNGYIEFLYDLPAGRPPSSIAPRAARAHQDDANVPPSWAQPTPGNPALQTATINLWKNLVAPYCMQCHRHNTHNFSDYEKFEPLGRVTGVNSELEAYLGVDREENGDFLFEDFPIAADRKALDKNPNEKKFAIKTSSRRRGKDFMPNAVQTRNELLDDELALKSMREWLVQSGSPDQPMIDVEFVVNTEVTTRAPFKNGDGRVITEDAYVAGSLAQLGSLSGETTNGLPKPADEKWDVTAGQKLIGGAGAGGFLRWTGKLRLPLHAEFRFKSYIMTNVAEQVRWQCARGLQAEDLKGTDGKTVLERSIDLADAGARSRDNLRVVLNGNEPDYAVKVRGDVTNPLSLRPEDAFLTIELGRPGQFGSIPEGHAVPHYEDKFHQDGKPPFDGGTIKCGK